MIQKQPAIVLRTVDFKESSSIATLLTPEFGKVAVMVRSVRKPGSKMSGLFQAGSILETVYYYKEGRSVQNLKEANQLHSTYNIRQQMEKMALATATLEMADQLSHENEPAGELYEFMVRLLTWLHQADGVPVHLFPYIQIRLADIMGIGIQLVETGESGDGHVMFLCVDKGEVTLQQQEGLCLKLQPQQTLYIKLALSNRRKALLRESFSPPEVRTLIHHLDVYLKHHLDGLRDRKSDYIFNQIL